MQIKINSTQMLGSNSISHVEGLINNFSWQGTPLLFTINIDTTLKDVDDKTYVQLVGMFENRRISIITDAPNITGAIRLAMKGIDSKMTGTKRTKHLKKKINRAA